MPKIPCPKCCGCLEVVRYGGIEIDRCVKCAGIWFDSLEAEALKKIHGSERVDAGNPEVGRQLDSLDEEICCPRCAIAMLRMLDLDEHSIWYEYCSRCRGKWLDAGEFKKFKQNFQSHRLVRQAKKALGWQNRRSL